MNIDSIDFCIARRRNDYGAAEIQCYEEFLQAALTQKEPIIYSLPYAKHRFLSYLTDAKSYLAHGSSFHDLTVLKPVRKTSDTEETGHEELLLAASDAIWAMWFAILDKSRMGKLTSNDCIVKTTEDNAVYSLYYFSVDHSVLSQHPYQNGTVYILPPQPFIHSRGEEKGSVDSVEPLFKIDISKEDFPYLPYVKGVDVEELKLAMINRVAENPWLSSPAVFPVSPEIPAEFRLVE